MPAIWNKITAEKIAAQTNGTIISGDQQITFSRISTDSRTIVSGELFWVLAGDRFDGHNFVQKAIDHGAAGIVVQKAHAHKISHSGVLPVIAVEDTLRAFGDLANWWRNQHDVRVAVITGSAGKTTTKEMTAGILEMGSKTLVTQGNFNNLIGLPKTLFRMEKGHKNAVLEMGMNRSGEIARLTEIADPDIGLITNVGMAHIEGLGDIHDVAKAKTELVEKMPSKGKTILNGDDPLLMETAARFRKETITFGLNKKNEIRADKLKKLGRKGFSFQLEYQKNTLPIRLNVPGLQNVSNALAAAAICLCLNEAHEHIIEGLYRFSGVKKRFTLIPLAGDILIVDDTYNANPSSLKAALESVGDMVDESSSIIIGLGEMLELGDATISAHMDAGRMVAKLGARHFLALGEHADEMLAGAVETGMDKNRVEKVATHNEMIKIIKDEMREGDLIFLKGSNKINLGKVVDGLRDNLKAE